MATDLNSSRRSTFNSNASQLLGVKMDCLLMIVSEPVRLIVDRRVFQLERRARIALTTRRRSELRISGLSVSIVRRLRGWFSLCGDFDLVQIHVVTSKKCFNYLRIEFQPGPIY